VLVDSDLLSKAILLILSTDSLIHLISVYVCANSLKQVHRNYSEYYLADRRVLVALLLACRYLVFVLLAQAIVKLSDLLMLIIVIL
jgi:hypothetical protein